MTRDHVLKIINIVFPIAGIGLMVFYEVCDTSCSALRGTFMGLDLKVIGILFMAVPVGVDPAAVVPLGHFRWLACERCSFPAPWAGRFSSSASRSSMIPIAPSAWPSVRSS